MNQNANGPQFQQFHFPNQQAAAGIIEVSENRIKPTLIACVDLNGGYAKDGKIPWNEPADMAWFQQQTNNHVCVMGRHTYTDIVRMIKEKGKEIGMSILPGRACFVVTSSTDPLEGARPVKQWGDVLKHVGENQKLFIIGGGQLWRETIAMADQVILTVINREHDCDQFFPRNYLLDRFQAVNVMEASTTKELRFITWQRIPGK